MELWIRSQDKRQLLKVNDGLYIANGFTDIDDTFIGIKNVGHVGRYAEEERALEILDEIQKKLQDKFLCKPNCVMKRQDIDRAEKILNMKYNKDFIMQPQVIDILPINCDNVVYEMPKE